MKTDLKKVRNIQEENIKSNSFFFPSFLAADGLHPPFGCAKMRQDVIKMGQKEEKNCGNCTTYFVFKFVENNPITKEPEQFGECLFFNDKTQVYNEKDYCVNHSGEQKRKKANKHE